MKNTQNHSNDKEAVQPNFFIAEFDSDDKVKKITIKPFKLVMLLLQLGFLRYDKDDQSYIVKIENNIIEEVTQTKVVDGFEEYIKSLPDPLIYDRHKKIPKEVIYNKVYRGIGTYFSEQMLKRLRSDQRISIVGDDRLSAHFFYRNGYVTVSKKGMKLHKYESLGDQKVWKNQILDREFKELKRAEFNNSNFAKFISNIANDHIMEKGKSNDPARLKSLQTIIGYNLHKYFHGKLKATIFTDSSMSDEPNGRTGKTLLAKAMGIMLNVDKSANTYVELNGKNFDTFDRFRYQECRIDTKLVHINDADRKFNFELLFNDISEGIKAQRKNEEPFLVEAKIIISTNRTIRISGGSAKDRSIEFEMSEYYGIHRSPAQEFGEWFFRDWKKEDWNQFDNYMLLCVQQYLKYGLIEPDNINLNERKLQEESAKEFVAYMDEAMDKTVSGQWYEKKELYYNFTNSYTDFGGMTKRTFTKWLKLYVNYSSDWKDHNEDNEKRTNGKDVIKFIKALRNEPI